jgi:hypothetical protein
MMKLNALQIETILNKLIPLIAAKEDEGFFRGVIGLKLESMSSAEAALFVKKLVEA